MLVRVFLQFGEFLVVVDGVLYVVQQVVQVVELVWVGGGLMEVVEQCLFWVVVEYVLY